MKLNLKTILLIGAALLAYDYFIGFSFSNSSNPPSS